MMEEERRRSSSCEARPRDSALFQPPFMKLLEIVAVSIQKDVTADMTVGLRLLTVVSVSENNHRVHLGCRFQE